jgi:hypothetical protein
MLVIYYKQIIKMGRFIGTVLSYMLEKVPEEVDTPKLMSLKIHLQKTHDSLKFSPPEMINSNYYWTVVGDYLNNSVSQEDYETIPWVQNVIDIFTDKIKIEE